MEFQVGDRVIWSRVNYDRTYSPSRLKVTRKPYLEPYNGVIVEEREKAYLVEFECGAQKWILKKTGRLEKIYPLERIK